MSSALSLLDVTKRYGARTALDRLSVEVPKGAVLGLVGPNGAGKTTTFGIVAGLVRPDAGNVRVLSELPGSPRLRGRLGLLPQDSELNPHTPVRDLLLFFARLHGMDARAAAHDVDRVLDEVHLRDRGGSRVRELSHGMRRRVAVAQALLGAPEIVLLDEPTSGLDPRLVFEMKELLRRQRGTRTLVVSSHVLSDLEAVCDELAFVEKGRCVRSGSADRLLRRDRLVRARLETPPDAEVVARIAAETELRIVATGATLVASSETLAPAAINAKLLPALVAAGLGVVEVRAGDSLEDTYRALDVPAS